VWRKPHPPCCHTGGVSWFLAFAGFAALIILHELGHFAAAKAVGMRVERFMLFFPPILARFRRGETEYGVGAIPLGGYVKISGMSPNEELPPEVASRAYLRQPVWKRIVVIGAGPAVNIVIAFLLIFALLLTSGITRSALNVEAVEQGKPAAGALRPGDRIVSIDGKPGAAPGLSPAQVEARQRVLRQQVQSHACRGGRTDGCVATSPAVVVVDRGGKRVTERIRPVYDAQTKIMRLGFVYGTTQEHVGVGQAARLTTSGMWNVTRLTVGSIVRLFYDSKARSEVSGVVGSYEVTRQAVQFDAGRAVEVLALISLSLGVINLFPFLPLDGGHIFWAVAEKLRGRPIPFRLIERVSVVGFMLVAFLFVVGLSNDIGRLTGEGFNVR
jgi:regulator of sigma E protease